MMRQIFFGSSHWFFSQLIAAVIVVFYLSTIYSFNFFIGESGFFQNGDPAQHVSGWYFFKNEDWKFPLLWVNNINYPEGTSIVFLDSIPLAAIFFKLFSSFLPEEFHYFGIWHAIAYLSLAVSASMLIRVFGFKSIFASAIAVLFVLLTPALALRAGHTALLTQVFLLFALCLYFCGMKSMIQTSYVSCLLIVNAVFALLVHPYLVVMVYGVFIAHLIDQYVKKGLFIKPCLQMLLSICVFVFIGLVFGYFVSGGQAEGFGLYSMNVASPFCGGRILNCVFDATGGQYEGYNYLGFGIIVLLCLSLFLNWEKIKQIKKIIQVFCWY